MKLHELRPEKGSRKTRKRVGRGNAGRGGTYAGRGRKGQNARSGGGVKPWFEGGQTPLAQRLPPMGGFTNIFKVHYKPVNLDRLDQFEAGAEVSPSTLAEAGIIKSVREPVAILGRGGLDRALQIKAHRVSKSARVKILEAGGSVEILSLQGQKPE
jgi:large subunit ribosomal protein L15